MPLVSDLSPQRQQVIFLEAILGDKTEGFVCISRRRQGERSWSDKFFYWPADVSEILDYIEQNYRNNDLYVCTTLLSSNVSRKAQFATQTQCVYADLDECPPESCDPPPSIVLVTSPGRYHGFWPLTRAVPTSQASEYSRRMAYAMESQGADNTGWDISQVLRIPCTRNFKYGSGVDIISHFISNSNGALLRFDPDVFESLPKLPPKPKGIGTIPWQDMPGIGDIPTYAHVRSKFFDHLSNKVQTLHDEGIPDGDDHSSAFFIEMSAMFELGARPVDAFAFGQKSKVNKWYRDRPDDNRLWADVLRIHHKVIVQDTTVTPYGIEVPDLQIDRSQVYLEGNFIESYVDCMSSETDAPRQYHELSATMLLSAVLAEHVLVETSIGKEKLNLWGMILGETTITRKSTAMGRAIDMLDEVDDSIMIATDEGSIEGLLDALSVREHKSSLYHRDEVVGMIKGMNKRDHMSGSLELYTKLYDGRTLKRNLRGNTISVRDPVFLFFCGGIKGQFFMQLRDEHMDSGFLPRFLYVIGETKIGDIKPLGKKQISNMLARQSLIKSLVAMKTAYSRTQHLTIAGQIHTEDVLFTVDPSQGALDVFNDFYTTMLNYAQNHIKSMTMVPMLSRMAMSGLRMAALLAAHRQTPQGESTTVEMTTADMYTAFYYINKWIPYTIEVVENAAQSFGERRLQEILLFINSVPEGVTHSAIMRRYHLSSNEMRSYVDTLVDRSHITVGINGRSKIYRGIANG